MRTTAGPGKDAASAPDAAGNAAARSGSFDPERLAWKAPPTWKRAAASPMRLVSFELGRDGSAECYVAVLGGAAGGLHANVDRWCSQMGKPALSAAEIAALPVLPMLGTEARLVRLRGAFTGMDGPTQSDAMLLGAICELADHAVFVKMVGPAADVEAEEARFQAFCRSLHY